MYTSNILGYIAYAVIIFSKIISTKSKMNKNVVYHYKIIVRYFSNYLASYWRLKISFIVSLFNRFKFVLLIVDKRRQQKLTCFQRWYNVVYLSVFGISLISPFLKAVTIMLSFCFNSRAVGLLFGMFSQHSFIINCISSGGAEFALNIGRVPDITCS